MKKRAWAVVPVLFCISLNANAVDTGDPNAAIRKLKQVTTPVNPLADVQRVQKLNNEQAILFFTNKIKKDPKDAVAYAKRGKAYSGNKDYDHALPDYDKAIQLDPKAADPYVGRAVIYLMKKDYDKSWADVHKAESLGGQFWPAFMEALKSGSGRDK